MRVISTGYDARPQFAPFHARTERFAVIVAHRRAGKTVSCGNDLIDGALRCPKPNPRFAYLAPYFKQAKDVAWQYIRDYTRAIPGVAYNEAELRADLPNGGRVRLYGADNPDSLRGIYLDGVVLDEVAQMEPELWDEVVRPTLSDRHGWAIFIGTVKSVDLFSETYARAVTLAARPPSGRRGSRPAGPTSGRNGCPGPRLPPRGGYRGRRSLGRR